jgi:DNA primase
VEVIQMGAVEIHPWGASIDAIDYPDRLIFDLDPAPDMPFDALKLAAQDLRQRLQKKGLESVLKFVDYFRNDYTATAIADYSVGARPSAPLAAPLKRADSSSQQLGQRIPS